MQQLVAGNELPGDAVSQAFWHACSGRQRRAAEYLLDLGADLDWRPGYVDSSPLDAARAGSTRQENVVNWLRERCASSAHPDGRR